MKKAMRVVGSAGSSQPPMTSHQSVNRAQSPRVRADGRRREHRVLSVVVADPGKIGSGDGGARQRGEFLA